MNRRLVRLYNDYKEVTELIGNHPYIEIKDVMGDPPERYLINYKIKGLIQNGKEIIEKDSHLCEIILSGDYPRYEPICRLISMVVFHPNIAPNKVCIADHWAAGESLADIIIRIGEMICYQNYNIKSPLNGEAAKWAEENIRRFPIDNVNLEPYRRTTGNQSEIKTVENPAYMPKEINVSEVNQDQNCSNCGASGKTISIIKCSNGHFVCPDCIIECKNCGKKLCVLCSLEKCISCGNILCQECQNSCIECNSFVCNEHIHKCFVCGSMLCNKCIFKCSYCSQELCYAHKYEHIAKHESGNLPDQHPIKNSSGNEPEKISFEEVVKIPELKVVSAVIQNTSCSNCGAGGNSVSIIECSNGHIVCQDCIVECGKCGNKLCVLCSLIKCSTCEKILCQECQIRCLECNSVICNDHIHTCSVCGSILCNQCISVCPDCHEELCQLHKMEHFRKHSVVESQDDTIIKITSEELMPKDLSNEQNNNRVNHELTLKKCFFCGYLIEEPDAIFCVMCGNRIKQL